MLADFRRALKDPALLELRGEIALVHARAVDLIKRVDSGESGHLWKLLLSAWDDVETAKATQDGARMAEALTATGQLIRRGTADYAAWEDACKQIDRKQRLVESERKRMVELQQVMTLDQAMLLVNAITEAVRLHVSNQQERSAIQTTVTKLLTG